ncbi:hypothetical protein [Limnofasciculus baicalensis]|uniref:Uncharacterized protein n=1 Tax=Limnofasciculus baicalensis BBK-W-15 TaxID=2699891 RepID=A0AAE3GU06_9CYAN|nr:hypothetical protein [Limnofasciculus baicalensis]MCP2728527.1 hypothetical protein [Limnofasciculus baicalensis BBK-W-15]
MQPRLSTILINTAIAVILSQGSSFLNQRDYVVLSQPIKETVPQLLKYSQEGKDKEAETYLHRDFERSYKESRIEPKYPISPSESNSESQDESPRWSI